MKFVNLFAFGAITLVIGACGKGATMGKQSSSRGDMESELHGAWSGVCDNNTTRRVTLDDKNVMTLERTTFADRDCTEKERSVKYTGTYKLHHIYKEGIPNMILLTVGNETKVVLNNDDDVDTQNSVLNQVANEKLDETKGTTPKQRADIKDKNEMLKQTKTVEQWKKGNEKTLTGLQVEKLNTKGLNVRPLGKVGTVVQLPYMVDNGNLILSGSEFGVVYATEKK